MSQTSLTSRPLPEQQHRPSPVNGGNLEPDPSVASSAASAGGSQPQTAANSSQAATRTTPMIGNINSPSVSLASVSSDDGSNESRGGGNVAGDPVPRSTNHIEREEMKELKHEVRRFMEALARLRRVFTDYSDRPDSLRKASHERLGEVLKVLREMLEKYPSLQTNELVGSAGFLIDQIKHFNYEADLAQDCGTVIDIDPKDFHEALDALATAFSSRVSEYVVGDFDSANPTQPYDNKGTPYHVVFPPYGDEDLGEDAGTEDAGDLDDETGDDARKDAILSVEQIDALLMRHDRGVDLALDRAKIWSKYAKDVKDYVDKRISMELAWARDLTKLAQTMRPVLKEESYLPFQSIYCTALDQDLEMCASTQATCSLLQGYKFMEPLTVQRTKHEKARKSLKERWNSERKRLRNSVTQLKKAKEQYISRQQDYERCREALRITEQGAEIGGIGEKKVDKHKRLEEDALHKTEEAESHYRFCVADANDRHRNILLVKTEILRGVRELIIECDQMMKDVTVNYFQLLHKLTAPVPTQYQTLCESSRLYDPGTQFMEYVKRMPESQVLHSTMSEPFSFEPFSDEAGVEAVRSKTSLRLGRPPTMETSSILVEEVHLSSRRKEMLGPIMAWTPSMGPIEPSDTESIESGKSSPTVSPLVTKDGSASGLSGAKGGDQPVIYFDNDSSDHRGGAAAAALATASKASVTDESSSSKAAAVPTSPTTPPQRQVWSRAAVTHRFRKIKTPSKCRECDGLVVYFHGYDCSECGLTTHKKCLETLALQCGHRRLPRKMTTFGVDLSAHLLETSSQVPPLVIKCVQEINARGLQVTGIYRVSAAKQKIEKLCQAFENGPELVDLTDIAPKVIADVLKLYMRQLPEPLLTFALCQDFIRVAESYPPSAATSTATTTISSSQPSSASTDGEPLAPLASAESPHITSSNLHEDQRRLRELCRRLPKPHYFTLGYLMHHLSKVADESETNNMTASNLAIVFAPTLLKTSQENLGMASFGEAKHHARVIELLIQYATLIFGPPELVMPREAINRNHGPHRGPRSRVANRTRSSRDSSDLISSQTERRGEVRQPDEFNIPGLVSSSEHNTGSNEDIFGASVSDEDDDADPIPLFLLNDRSGRSPLLYRGSSSPPKIIKQSLKNFSGLEGVTAGMLSTQDSLEVAQRPTTAPGGGTTTPLVTSTTTATARRSVHHDLSMPVASTSEVNTAVFHKMGRAAKKHSLDEDYLGLDGTGLVDAPTVGADAVDYSSQIKTTSPPAPSSNFRSTSASTVTSLRSGSLSEDVASATSTSRRRAIVSSRSTGMTSDTSSIGVHHHQPLSQSMPTTIANLEENRVTIQVPGVQNTTAVSHRSHHPTVVKHTSVDKAE